MRVFIENEAGSRRKHIYDRNLVLVGTVEVSAAYPYPYGLLLGTSGGDGDAVDCFVLTETRLRSGSIVACEPIGLLEQVEDGAIDHKVLAVPSGTSTALDEPLIARLRDFIAGVFAHVPGKRMELGCLRGRAAAEDCLMQCRGANCEFIP
jgi:inorganic pyrophosphatase